MNAFNPGSSSIESANSATFQRSVSIGDQRGYVDGGYSDGGYGDDEHGHEPGRGHGNPYMKTLVFLVALVLLCVICFGCALFVRAKLSLMP